MYLRGRPLTAQPQTLLPRGRSLTVGITCGESRVGIVPIPIPSNVEYKLTGRYLSVKGPLGTLEHDFPEEVDLREKNGRIYVDRIVLTKRGKAMHGLSRALCSNMFVGVSRGFEKILIMNGVGYRAEVQGEKLELNVGYSHPVLLDIPKGCKVKVEETIKIIISGFDRAVLGNFAAVVRSIRKPEPYKGKGIRYENEVIRLKSAKRGK